MGNCCLPDGQMYILVTEHGNEYEKLVCDKCHRPDHSRKYCYANTYADGSLLTIICHNCGLYHTTGWYNNNKCTNFRQS